MAQPPSSFLTTTTPAPPSHSLIKPQKRKRKRSPIPHVLHQVTLRNPSWTYLHLSLLPPTTTTSASTTITLDAITARTLLTPPLVQFLGHTGAAIPFDILKLEGRDVWVRVPREDAGRVVAGLSGWVGEGVAWRVKGRGEWLGAVGGHEELFG
ncbi:hypothetical protein K432DRAFT_425819 [Lepidopterella palustris CBS 459.81]|uniref:Ribonucleases P/MRP subunit Pop8-like domain-containing protein n=1 Tax=Lepidopterella palustris CBS 459.81 TaxID=1314670 RepID=A0A8E2EAE1_9PEZI|nr:hypothetical protein K432DRAFT_425819 [Lepidopterella palustris CBS 459.81]